MPEAPSHKNSVVKPLGCLNNGGASAPRAAATGGVWFTRCPKKLRGQGGSGFAFSSLPFPAGYEDHCYLQQKKTHKQSILVFFFVLQICFPLGSLFSFRFPFLSVSGGQQCDQGTVDEWISVVAVKLLAAGSGLGEDEGLRAARRRSQWLREWSVRYGEERTGDGLMVLWPGEAG